MGADVTDAPRRARDTVRLPVENPALAEDFAQVPIASRQDVDRAVRAAGAAFPGWEELRPTQRAALLRRCGAALGRHIDELAGTLTREQGKPLADARTEARLAADWFGHTAELVLAPETLVDGEDRRVVMRRVPYGPVAAVAPSNFPLILAVAKIAPALLAGNTVVVKPSEATPLSTVRMVEILDSVLPPGVLSAVCGARGTAAALVGHPAVRLVSFTGSVEVGRAIAGTAAGGLKHLILELGGNDACVILPGADISAVAPGVFAGAMVNNGQFCAAVKRVYVSEPQAGELVDALAQLAGTARVGDGAVAGTAYGPLVSRAQLDRVAGLVDSARSAGARVIRPGTPPELPGHFLRPTVVTDLPAVSRLEAEEQFGPVVPVIGYRDVETALARANGTPFGLGGSVWGDQEQAERVAARLDCGTAWTNTHGLLHPRVPFGGFGVSGMGVEYGYWGLLEYTRPKIHHARPRHPPHPPA